MPDYFSLKPKMAAQKVSRRHLIKSGIGFCASLSLSIASSVMAKDLVPAKTKPKRRRVIVIGAGLSGLSAARVLAASGDFELIILEARSRIGGRIWTDTSSLKTPIDLGASWIHGIKKNPLFEMASAHGFKLVPTRNDLRPDTYTADGTLLNAEQRDAMDRLDKQIMDLAYQKQDALAPGKDMSLGAALNQILKKQKLPRESEIRQRHLISTEIETDYATDIDTLSFRQWDKVHWFNGRDVLLPQGYLQVLNLLAADLDIRLEKVVSKIAYDKSGVRIQLSDGTVMTADHALVTLPLGVLKSGSVAFSPELPAKKKEAILGLEMGLLDKIYLKFDERFWSEQAYWIEYMGKDPRAWPEFLNVWKHTGEPILVGLNAGSYAHELEEKTDEQILAEAMKVLRTMYGDKVKEPVAYKTTRWSNDPFARGSYSYIPSGKSAALYDYLGAAIGNRLFFAGEASNSKDYSSAHAAYLSGIRAAQQIKDC